MARLKASDRKEKKWSLRHIATGESRAERIGNPLLADEVCK